MTTGKNVALIIWTPVNKVMSLLFNILSRFVHLGKGHSPALDCFWYLLAVPVASVARSSRLSGGSSSRKVQLVQLPLPLSSEADTLTHPGSRHTQCQLWHSDLDRQEQHYTITADHCRSLSQGGNSGQYYLGTAKRLLVSTCCLFPVDTFLVILWCGNELYSFICFFFYR